MFPLLKNSGISAYTLKKLTLEGIKHCLWNYSTLYFTDSVVIRGVSEK